MGGKRASIVFAVVALAGATIAAPPSAQADAEAIVTSSGCSSNQLAPGDDPVVGPIELPFIVDFFGEAFWEVYISNNGNVTFGEAQSFVIPFAQDADIPPMIAPFFADVDTGVANSGEVTYGSTTFEGRSTFCVTWHRVGRFQGDTSKTNTFQLLLVDRSDDGAAGDFEMIFNYESLAWDTGDDSTAAASAGFSSGRNIAAEHYERAGSREPGALLDDGDFRLATSSTESTVAGRHRFEMTNGVSVDADPSAGPADDDEGPPLGQWYSPRAIHLSNQVHLLGEAGDDITGIVGQVEGSIVDFEISNYGGVVWAVEKNSDGYFVWSFTLNGDNVQRRHIVSDPAASGVEIAISSRFGDRAFIGILKNHGSSVAPNRHWSFHHADAADDEVSSAILDTKLIDDVDDDFFNPFTLAGISLSTNRIENLFYFVNKGKIFKVNGSSGSAAPVADNRDLRFNGAPLDDDTLNDGFAGLDVEGFTILTSHNLDGDSGPYRVLRYTTSGAGPTIIRETPPGGNSIWKASEGNLSVHRLFPQRMAWCEFGPGDTKTACFLDAELTDPVEVVPAAPDLESGWINMPESDFGLGQEGWVVNEFGTSSTEAVTYSERPGAFSRHRVGALYTYRGGSFGTSIGSPIMSTSGSYILGYNDTDSSTFGGFNGLTVAARSRGVSTLQTGLQIPSTRYRYTPERDLEISVRSSTAAAVRVWAMRDGYENPNRYADNVFEAGTGAPIELTQVPGTDEWTGVLPLNGEPPVNSSLRIAAINEDENGAEYLDVAARAPGYFTGNGSPSIRPFRPARLLDTRSGLGTNSLTSQLAPTIERAAGPVGGNQEIEVQVTGRNGIPTDGVGAVVLNVTATEATNDTFVTVWPTGEPRPTTSNLNIRAGDTTPNLVIAKLGANGKVSLFNRFGDTHLIADVAAWIPAGPEYVSLNPDRILDSRSGNGAPAAPVGAGQSIDLQVAGRGGVPSDAASAVVLNVTATEPTANTFVTVWPTGETRPTASNLNMTPGLTIPNAVIAKLGTDGKVSLFNGFGSTHLTADVLGWFPKNSGFNSLTPSRVLDTRFANGAPDAPVGTNGSIELQVTGRGGVPSDGVGAVVLNVTATEPTANSFVTVWPSDESRPTNASNLNVRPGQTVPNLVVAKVSSDGKVSLFNRAGSVELIADVLGWFPA